MTDPASADGDPALLTQLERARRLGLLGPGPVVEHVRHSLGFLPALDPAAGIVGDLGSGAGVPGLPLALARPDLRFVLLEVGSRRAAFLREAVDELGLEARVEVLEARAEVLGRGPLRSTLAAVVARSFGAPAVTAECAAPLLAPGGRLLVSEPPEPSDGRWSASGLAALGLRLGPTVPGPPRIQVLEQVELCPARYPRRDGVPARRPLF